MEKYYNRGGQILKLSIIFWILETIFFLIIQGWHWDATTQVEKFCDKFVGYGIDIGVIFIFLAFMKTTEYVINFSKDYSEYFKNDIYK